MPAYAILCNPGHNRVYFEATQALSAAELAIASRWMQSPPHGIEHTLIAGIPYLTFDVNALLSLEDLTILSGLSFVYAIFERRGDTLYPVMKPGFEFVDGSISTILKYTGKTNELFTRLLISVALYSQDRRSGVKLLDPVMGKGTTLFEGLIRGLDVYGIEIGEKPVNEAYHFLRRFLEAAKTKHCVHSEKISGPNKSFRAQRHTFTVSAAKTAEMVCGNAIYADQLYKRDFFDLVVGDLPYGVQHGNVTGEKASSLTRNPSELLAACLPAWRTVLKPGGVLALSWNTRILSRRRITELIAGKGFEVLEGEPYLQFCHSVDQAVLRDVIIARRCK
jgi:SAM-dependent methyltransferase